MNCISNQIMGAGYTRPTSAYTDEDWDNIPFLPPKRGYGQSKQHKVRPRTVAVLMVAPPEAPRLIIIIVIVYAQAIKIEGQSDDNASKA